MINRCRERDMSDELREAIRGAVLALCAKQPCRCAQTVDAVMAVIDAHTERVAVTTRHLMDGSGFAVHGPTWYHVQLGRPCDEGTVRLTMLKGSGSWESSSG